MIGMPESVKAILDASIWRVRRIYLLRGIAATLFVAITATLVVMAVDACFTLFSDAARWLLSSLLYGCILLAGYLSLVRPLARRLDARRMAKILDARHPENEECLTTLVELVETAELNPGRANFSAELLELLSKKAAAAALSVDAEREFTSRTILRRLKALLAIVALLALSFVIVPHLAGRLFVRAVAPWADVGNLYSSDITVKPGDVAVLGGMVVRIEATVAEGFPYAPSIRISRKGALGWGEEYVEPMDGGVYEATADLAEPEWRYRVCAGPAVSRYYTVRVCEMPRYKSFSARIDYPDYTGFSPSVVSNDEVSTLEAVDGSRVSFSLDLGDRAVNAALLVNGRAATRHEMVSNRVANWTLDLVSPEGFAAPRRGGLLKSFLDAPPTVVIEEPAVKSLRLAPHAKFPIVFSASDDIGVETPSLRYARDGGPWQDLRTVASFAKSGLSLWKGKDEIDLSTFDLDGVRLVSFDIVVRDRFPAERGGPHAATSMPIVVQLETRAASIGEQSLSKAAETARKLLDEARRRLHDARHPAAQAKDQIRREQKVSKGADKNVERAVHETSEARKRVDELERHFREDRRFEPIADMLKSVREQKIDSVLAKLESAQFDAPERRADALEAALPEMRDALEALKKMGEPIRDRVQKLENYEKTKDLAARQDALAREAEAILREKPVDTRKLDAWKRLQEEAANKARELEGRTKDGDMDVARRKMSKAAELMDELKRQLDIAADKNRSDIGKAQARDQYEDELSRRRDDALRQAVNAEKDARRKLEQARANGNKRARKALMRDAAAAQSRAEDLLEQAEATKEVKDAQREARLRNDNPDTVEQALGESLPRQGEALAAAEAELAAREKARQEGMQARKERDEAARRSLAEQNANERREAQHHEARMAAMKAQNKALSAFEEAAKSEDENRSRQLRQQAADAVREAARQLEKSGVDPTLADAQEKSLAAAKAAVEEPSAGKVAEDVQRKTADALAAVDKAEQLESAAAAKELAESLERESNLPEDVLQGLERLKKSDPSSGQAASEAREAATAAREDAARKIEEAAAAAEQAGQLAENATRAVAAGAEAAAQQTSSPQGKGEQGERKQGDGEQAEGKQGVGEQAQSGQESQGEPHGRSGVGEKSAEAAEAMRKEAQRQANALGIPDGQEEGQSQSGESNPSEQQGESNPGEPNSGEPNSGESNQRESSSGKGKGNAESQGGGGLSAEIARLIREQSSKADPAALSKILENQGWFRIKGAAKDGLGDRNLKDVPAEYRDLVRAYFLKLSEEK